VTGRPHHRTAGGQPEGLPARATGVPLIIVGFLAALIAVIAIGVVMWRQIGEADISPVGYLALAGGVIVTLALGIGLMALVFISSRQGYDDIDRKGPPG
jgi:hypothetical protein